MRTLFLLAIMVVTFGLNYLAEAESASAPQSQWLSITQLQTSPKAVLGEMPTYEAKF